jgi:hypothetical protein
MKKLIGAGTALVVGLTLSAGPALAGFTVPAKVAPASVQRAPEASKDKDKDKGDKKDKKPKKDKCPKGTKVKDYCEDDGD